MRWLVKHHTNIDVHPPPSLEKRKEKREKVNGNLHETVSLKQSK